MKKIVKILIVAIVMSVAAPAWAMEKPSAQHAFDTACDKLQKKITVIREIKAAYDDVLNSKKILFDAIKEKDIQQQYIQNVQTSLDKLIGMGYVLGSLMPLYQAYVRAKQTLDKEKKKESRGTQQQQVGCDAAQLLEPVVSNRAYERIQSESRVVINRANTLLASGAQDIQQQQEVETREREKQDKRKLQELKSEYWKMHDTYRGILNTIDGLRQGYEPRADQEADRQNLEHWEGLWNDFRNKAQQNYEQLKLFKKKIEEIASLAESLGETFAMIDISGDEFKQVEKYLISPAALEQFKDVQKNQQQQQRAADEALAKRLEQEQLAQQQLAQQQQPIQQPQNGKPIAWYKSPRLVQGLGVVAATAATLATLFVGLKWYQKKQISRVVTKYGLMQDDFTDHQQNLLAAALLASYRVPQAVSKLQILVDQGVGSASVPKKQMWQILAELYWRKSVDQAKISEFKKLVK